MSVQVFEPGSKVKCNHQECEVLFVSIGHLGVIEYKVGYWKEDEWITVWLPTTQVEGSHFSKIEIGFKAGE